jgi:hypothetical protein
MSEQPQQELPAAQRAHAKIDEQLTAALAELDAVAAALELQASFAAEPTG